MTEVHSPLDPWVRYRAWLERHAPAAYANLGPPASPSAVSDLERELGQALPDGVRRLLLENDGQRDPGGCFVVPGLELLSTQRILEEWKVWARLRETETADGLESLDDYSRALDEGVLDVYTHPGWIPLLKDGYRSDYLGADLAPAEGGAAGQIINFGRDEDQHFIAFPDVAGCIEFWLAEAEAGRCVEAPPKEEGGAPSFAHVDGNAIDVLRP